MIESTSTAFDLGELRPSAADAVASARTALRDEYGDRLAGILLYGSHARGDAHPDSDVDLLVLLHGRVNAVEELRQLGALMMRLMSEHGEDVAFQVYGEEAFASGSSPFLLNVREEGAQV